MPFCPKCRSEYREGFETCSDCGEMLVNILPEQDIGEGELPPQYHDWIAVARLTSRQYSAMVLEIFHTKGIPAVVNSGAGYFGNLDQLGPASFRPVGGAYSVMVPRSYVVDADREAEIVLGDVWRNSRLIDIKEF
jgi:hypothetical protein